MIRRLQVEKLESRQLMATFGNVGTTVLDFTAGSAPVPVAPQAAIRAPLPANFNRGSLVVTNAVNAQPTDWLTIHTGGDIQITNRDVYVKGAYVGRVTAAGDGVPVEGNGPTPLTIKFGAAATPQAVQTLLNNFQFAQRSNPGSGARRTITFELTDPLAPSTVTYKTAGGVDLPAVVLKPNDWTPTDQRPAVVFCGNNWFSTSTTRMDEYARYFNRLGIVVVQTQHRTISSTGNALPVEPVMDARSAIRWVRAHAAELGVDPQRIAAAGPSAGGEMAALTGLSDAFDDPADDLSVSGRANALLLLNPVLNTGPDGGWGYNNVQDQWRAYSPDENISSDDAPTLLLFGDQDQVSPPAEVNKVQQLYTAAGVRCDVVFYPGQAHGFFNADRANAKYTYLTMQAMGHFLTSLEWAAYQEPDMPVAYAVSSGVLDSQRTFVRVVNTNHPPQIALTATTKGFTSGGPPMLLFADSTVSDQDARPFTGGSLVVTGLAGGDQILPGGRFSTSANALYYNPDQVAPLKIGTVSGSTFSFNGNATVDLVQRLTRMLRFAATQSGSRTLDFQLNDGAGGSASAAVTIAVNG
jgi:acetyl esterase/lipase